MNYLELNIVVKEVQPWNEICMAELSDWGFESFTETDEGLLAYIQEEEYDERVLSSIKAYGDAIQSVSYKLIKQQNWNAEWESNFDPIYVDDWCVIRAPFHDKTSSSLEIIIEPKMSFGTGHHQTTFMMMQYLKELALNGATVLDMGSGTGVLAIAAKKLGSSKTVAIDIEEWAYKNCLENINLNGVAEIEVIEGGKEVMPNESFDFILANINRNALVDMLPQLSERMTDNASLLLSGFLAADYEYMNEKVQEVGLKIVSLKNKENWICLQCQKQ